MIQSIQSQPTTVTQPILPSSSSLPFQSQYQLSSSLGNLTLQLIQFPSYIILILTQSSNHNLINGSLQISMKTQYGEHASVIDIGKDQHMSENQDLSRMLAQALGIAVLLSYNLEVSITRSQAKGIVQFVKGKVQMNRNGHANNNANNNNQNSSSNSNQNSSNNNMNGNHSIN